MQRETGRKYDEEKCNKQHRVEIEGHTGLLYPAAQKEDK